MREIKFRALSKNGKWAYATLQELVAGVEFVDNPDELISFIRAINDGAEPNEYTGLKDKNGKEIYEGDVLAFGDIMGKVYFDEGCFRQEVQYRNPKEGQRRDVFGSHIVDVRSEIIGNIYQTPSLLEAK